MSESVKYFEDKITEILQNSGRYSPSLELNIWLAANALTRYSIANRELYDEGHVTITTDTKNGISTTSHPAARIAAEAEDKILKMFKQLGMTFQDFREITEGDPTADLVTDVHEVITSTGAVIKPK